MRRLFAAAAISLVTLPAFAADLISLETNKSVPEAMDALEAAVTGAGATVFARIDHQKGAESVDLQMPAAQTLIFGNPKLGTPAMQADLRASLYLPLKVAIYEADGGAVITYEDPAAMFEGLDIPADAKVVQMMTGALGKLTGAAAN